MGKALKTVGMVVGAAALVATGAGALLMPGMGQITLFGLTTGQLNMMSAGAMAVGGMLDKPQSVGSGAVDEWTSNPDQPIPFAFGRVGVAGKIVHRDEYGPDNRLQSIVSVYSGAGPIRGFLSYKADGATIAFELNGGTAVGKYKGQMWRSWRRGSQPDAALALPINLDGDAVMPGWDEFCKLSGKACDLLTVQQDSKFSVYPTGLPTPTVELDGIHGYDPRYDDTYPGGAGTCRLGVRSTYRWIDNPIIAGLNWALGLFENGKVVGGIGASINGIDVPAFVEAANIADVNNWKVTAWPDTSEDVSEVLKQFLQAGGASYARHAGKISCVSRGAARPSIVTITGRDTAGPFDLDTGASQFNRLNTITPEFMSAAHGWKHIPARPVTFEDLRLEDGGTRSDSIRYRFVPSALQAGQLAAYDILDAREPFAGTVPLKPHLRQLKRGDCFVIDEPGFLLDGVKCLVLGRTYNPTKGEVRIAFRSETDAKHDLALGKTAIVPNYPGLTAPDPTFVSPPAPDEWIVIPRLPNEYAVEIPIIDIVGEVANATATAMRVEWGYEPNPSPPDPIPVAPEGERQPVWADFVEWRSAAIWPVTATRITLEGAPPGDSVYVALSYQRGQNWSERTVHGPVVVPGLVAGDTTHVGGVPVDEIPAFDTTPPANPTGLSLSSSSVTDSAGNPYVQIKAAWTANTEADLDGYEVEITEAGFTVVDVARTNSWSRNGLTGRSYSIRVRAFDKAGNRSGWTAVQTVTGAGDTTPPPAPTGLTVAASLGSFFLEWTNPSVSDLSKIEVWEHTSNASASATRIATVNAQPGAKGGYARSGLSGGDVRWYWLKAVDTSGNVSSFSVGASGTIPSVPAGEIDTTPPGLPTGLSLANSAVIDAGTGLPRARIIATWTGPGDADLAGFDVEVTEGAGNPVTRMVSTARDQWDARPNVTYTVRVRAFDRVGNRSGWTTSATITTAADSVAPAAPTGLAAVASVGSIFLSGTAPADVDVAKIEVWENTVNNSATATRIAVVNAIPGGNWAHPRTGLSANDTRWYWAKAVDTSGNASAFSAGISKTVPYVANPDIAVGTLAGDRLVANSVEGSVFKTNTSLPGTITVGSTGVSIGTLQSQAANPAGTINSGATVIDPGKIQISGATTLADWRMGGDETRINGGSISANTVTANKLTIGSRGITFTGITFEANKPATNQLSWTGGAIAYTNDSGVASIAAVTSGSLTWTSGTYYVYWTKGGSSLSVTQTYAVANSDNTVVLATYQGGLGLYVHVGSTVIDGSGIKTNSITSNQIASGAITTGKLAAGAVTANEIQAGSITGDRISTSTSLPGSITVGSTGVSIGTVQSQAANPANTINAGTTQITPGKILIQGSTSLDSWRDGTEINGGSIKANSISAEKLTIAQRGISTTGLDFTTNEAGTTLSCSGGYVIYISDTGATVATYIPPQSFTGSGKFIYWTKGASSLGRSDLDSAASNPNNVLIAQWDVGTRNFRTFYGGTIITPNRISTPDLSAISANVGTVTAGMVQNSAGTTFFDLSNARSQYRRGSYDLRMGSIGSGVAFWYGLSSVGIGLETRTNGKWAFGDDGKVYYGASELQTSAQFHAQADHAVRIGTRTSPGQVTTSLVTITTSGATGTVTYEWTQIGGDETWIITSPSGPSTTFRVNVATPGEQKRATFACLVKDAGSGRSYTVVVGGAAIYNV